MIVVRAHSYLFLLYFYLHHLAHDDFNLMYHIAGSNDTSATTLQWAMAELMRNPAVMSKLQDEVRGAFAVTMKVSEDRGGPKGVELLAHGHQRDSAAASSIAAAVAQRVPRTMPNPQLRRAQGGHGDGQCRCLVF